MDEMIQRLTGTEHWTHKGDVRLFLWNKCAVDAAAAKATILFVHGSSMASQPTFDLHVPGRPDSSAMEFFAGRGYDTWSVDMEGYGRSTKTRDNNAPIAFGAEDCFAAAAYIQKLRGLKPLLVYDTLAVGIDIGAMTFFGRHTINRDMEPNRLAVCRTEHEVQIAGMEPVDDAALLAIEVCPLFADRPVP